MRADERHDDEKLYHKMTIGELQNRYPNVIKNSYVITLQIGVNYNFHKKDLPFLIDKCVFFIRN